MNLRQMLKKERTQREAESESFEQGDSIVFPVIYFVIYCTILLGEGNGTLLQYSCLENPMDGGAW